MENPTFRDAVSGDCEEAIALWHAAGLTRPWNDPHADFALAIARPDSTILLAEYDGVVAGSVMVGFDGHRGWVYYLAVAPDRRRCGLGRALMQQAEGWLTERGCPAIRLMLRTDNAEARGFYEALGYGEQAVATYGRRLDVAGGSE